ncbi:MAG: sigma-54 dependent transcriptional regulator [Acidobacteriota bacterium]
MPQPDLILIVEDEPGLRESLGDALQAEGYSVEIAADLAQARAVLSHSEPSGLLLDLALPDGSGMELIEELSEQVLAPAIVVLTADAAIDSAVGAVRSGASDYLGKPFSLELLRHRLRTALQQRAARLDRLVSSRQGLLAGARTNVIRPTSSAMRTVLEEVARVATHDSIPVLVRGETGVGKESICRSLHAQSPRSEEPFIAVNCAELERSLLRSELFGHERGAFTGATQRRAGLFELASQGTLMLDEISELPLDVQALLLRVLEDGSFRRLGGGKERVTHARIISVSNKSLDALVEQGQFRQDLLFRLNTVEITIPPLRDRIEDIHLLARHFCRQAAKASGYEVDLTTAAFDALAAYPWPGNVRELRNVVERSVLLSQGHDLTPESLGLRTSDGPPSDSPSSRPETEPVDATLKEVERRHIDRVLSHTGGNRTRAASMLGISRSTLIRKLQHNKVAMPGN